MAEIKSSETQTGGTQRPVQMDAATETAPAYGDAAHYPGQNALRSAGAVGGGAVGMTHGVLRQAITATEDVGSGLVGGATHLAQDVVHGVRDLAVDATHAVSDLLVEVVGGVRHIADAAMGRAASTGARSSVAGETADEALQTETTQYRQQSSRPNGGGASPGV